MKQIIRIEELAMTIGALYLTAQLNLSISWWLYPVIFLAPDLSMLGYVFNPGAGAVCYNLGHHKALAIAVIITGLVTSNNYITFAGLMLFAHSSFDRIMGYGLKYADSFGHTHLGTVDKHK